MQGKEYRAIGGEGWCEAEATGEISKPPSIGGSSTTGMHFKGFEPATCSRTWHREGGAEGRPGGVGVPQALERGQVPVEQRALAGEKYLDGVKLCMYYCDACAGHSCDFRYGAAGRMREQGLKELGHMELREPSCYSRHDVLSTACKLP